MAEVVLKKVCKSFGRIETIHDVDIAIDDGEFVVFVGPSGCGKSTLLRMVAGLEDITSGDLTMDGRRVNDLSPKDRRIAMVFQSYALYPHMTVYQNMAFGLELSKARAETIDDKVRRAAEILELTPLLDRLPKQLSGGQRQRVAIGRAIVREPGVFLFDEPLSNLDAALRVQMRIEIAKLHRDMGVTMIYVTHDQVEAMTLADKIVVLRAGRVEQIGAPLDLYLKPANLFVAGFIGSPQMNFVKARVNVVGPTSVTVELPGGALVNVAASPAAITASRLGQGDAVTFGVRPEHVTRAGVGATLAGVVEVVEELGESHLIYCRLGDGTLFTVRAAGISGLKIGDSLPLAMDPASTHLFDGAGIALR
jgi:ABC-type sugar transport system ATPase subunit